jgi:hypothetical protein
VEARRCRLAEKGWNLQKSIICPGPDGIGPPGCGRVIKRRDLRHHLIYDCSCRLIRCKFYKNHVNTIEGSYNNKLKPLTFSVMHCDATFKESERDEHEKYDCPVILSIKQTHRVLDDRRVLQPCLYCYELITTNNLKQHQEKGCEFRFVSCPSGCGQLVRYNRIHHHILYVELFCGGNAI